MVDGFIINLAVTLFSSGVIIGYLVSHSQMIGELKQSINYLKEEIKEVKERIKRIEDLLLNHVRFNSNNGTENS